MELHFLIVSLKQKETVYFLIEKPESQITYADIPTLFTKAEEARKKLAERIVLQTQDGYINPLAGALVITADAFW